MKKKLIFISGLTAVGKSNLAVGLARLLNTEIIVGDSLQIYKNFPVSSNFPSPIVRKSLDYHLLGVLNVFEKRIITSDYKKMVLEKMEDIYAKGKIPIIEGGSGFYLNYLLTSTDVLHDDNIWNEVCEKAAALVKENPDWEKLANKLKEIYPSYDDSLPKNDFYRMEKAIRYALASNGESIQPKKGTEQSIKDLYDVRGFFLTMNGPNIKKSIEERCYSMVGKGIIEEFLDYVANQKLVKDYSEIPTPIGYHDMEKFINALIDHNQKKYAKEADNIKKISKLSKNFISEFQIKSRQYAQYQRKYFRSKFRYFVWKEVQQPVKEKSPLIQEVYEEVMCSPEEFSQKVIAPSNLDILTRHINTEDQKSYTPFRDPQLENILIQYVIKKLMPKIGTMDKIKIFESVE